MIEPWKYVCTECWQKHFDGEVRRAPSPFDPEDILSGCKNCSAVNKLMLICDEPGCWEDQCCGTPKKDGYRMTCSNHKPSAEEK